MSKDGPKAAHGRDVWIDVAEDVVDGLEKNYNPTDVRNILCYSLAYLIGKHDYEEWDSLGLSVHGLTQAFVDMCL